MIGRGTSISSFLRWPEFFQIDKPNDQAHLNAAGAGVLTRIVATDFIGLARCPANSR